MRGIKMREQIVSALKAGCYYLVFAGNVLLGVLYLFGSLAVLLPEKSPVIPDGLGVVAIGILLALTGCFGRPYFPNARYEDRDTL
jgi:hypothetical protein